ncbi:MAG: L,D-transpeptidase [Chloroflexi bacterium]|nr:MAG: L,D-transpeptidase [Chloroflexota bacterium]
MYHGLRCIYPFRFSSHHIIRPGGIARTMSYQFISSRHLRKAMATISIALLVMLALSACGSESGLQKQATREKAILDQTIAHAQGIGVPHNVLKSIMDQETQVNTAPTPVPLFSDQPAHAYYNNLAQRYQILTLQVQGLETKVTEQLDYQTMLDMKSFATLLAQRQAEGFVETKTFADQLAVNQSQMAQAQYPKHYLQIGASARKSTQALRLMGPANDALTNFRNLIKQLADSRLDVTALRQQEQDDLSQFRSATQPDDFTRLINLINAQIQTTSALSAQAIPYVGTAKLKQLGLDLDQMAQWGVNVTGYRQRLAADQNALDHAKSLRDFLKVSSQIDSDVAATQIPYLKAQASTLLKQFHQEVADWGATHQYVDPMNGHSYPLDYEYDEQGIGSDADAALFSAKTEDDYRALVNLAQNNILHLHSMEAAYNDKTPANQVHETDTQLLQHYRLTAGQVIVVSLIEQALRLYQDGKVVQSFLITTGQYDKPSLPGYWHIFVRESPTKFKSSEPKGSAFWYPDTNINFAMEYHDGGYFFHDSWWRADYGPGTNFPHVDSGGDQSFSGNGSHGCVNMPEKMASWLYNHTSYGTPVIIY